MTVANQTNRTSAVGSGGTGQDVPFSFPITNTSDLIVYKRVTATGVQTALAETTNYTVEISGDIGGTLTTVTAIETTEEIHLVRATPSTQSLDLEQGGLVIGMASGLAIWKRTQLKGKRAPAQRVGAAWASRRVAHADKAFKDLPA